MHAGISFLLSVEQLQALLFPLPMASPDVAPAGLLDDYPGVDDRSCQLLGPTALVIILLLNRRENPILI